MPGQLHINEGLVNLKKHENTIEFGRVYRRCANNYKIDLVLTSAKP
jgi:hypothetical protein